MKSYNEWVQLQEGVPSNQLTAVTVVARDYDGKLKKLLECIKKCGNCGHSFSIIVDPDGDDTERFDWDGDGSDYIKEVTVSKVNEVLKDNN